MNFLHNHPTEFVLMHVQREHGSAGNTTEFDALDHDVCMGFKNFLAPGVLNEQQN